MLSKHETKHEAPAFCKVARIPWLKLTKILWGLNQAGKIVI